MRNGIYFIIICRRIDNNGIAIDPINCNIAECDYEQFKKKIESENWKIYCRSTLESNPEKYLDPESTSIGL